MSSEYWKNSTNGAGLTVVDKHVKRTDNEARGVVLELAQGFEEYERPSGVIRALIV
jgi:hypothetical protein